MNKTMFSYLLTDAWIGLKRNKGATMATTAFLAITITFLSTFLLIRVFMSDVTDYLQMQLSMKVYVEQQVNTEDVAAILQKQSYVKEVDIESGEEILEQLSFFFTKRDYLLDAFKGGKVNDAIHLTLTDSENIDEVAAALSKIKGIESVVYPQKLAQTLQEGLTKLTLYGIIMTVVLISISFLMVYMTFHLALYRRQRELKVKLLVGMNPKHLRLQFFIESFFFAFGGAIVASSMTILMYRLLNETVAKYVAFLAPLQPIDAVICIATAIIIGFMMSLLASYVATRKWLRHA